MARLNKKIPDFKHGRPYKLYMIEKRVTVAAGTIKPKGLRLAIKPLAFKNTRLHAIRQRKQGEAPFPFLFSPWSGRVKPR